MCKVATVFESIAPKVAETTPTTAQTLSGVPIPPISLLPVLSPDDWEQFTHEYLWFFKNSGIYRDVKRYAGPGDLGLDLVAFKTDAGFGGAWDSYQCKQYDHALQPNDVAVEVVKIIYHSYTKVPPFNQSHRVPDRHAFICPHGVGITAGRWFKDPKRFKEAIRTRWDDCIRNVESGLSAPLSGDLLSYFDELDFNIFGDIAAVDLIAIHAKTPFYPARFGGGLPPKKDPSPPPVIPTPEESIYLRKILNAYGDSLGAELVSIDDAPTLKSHYGRQRIAFSCAEYLRGYASQCTMPATFEAFQEDIYNGVIDVCEDDHKDGLQRLREVIKAAAQVAASGNALFFVSTVSERQGICHQLANIDRLDWVKR